MIFTQLVFLAFFLVVFSVYYALPSSKWRKHWLLVASYYFYGYWDYRFLGLILFATTFDFFTASFLDKTESPRQRKLLITLSLVANLGVLGFFKYFNFFVDSGVGLLNALGVPATAPDLQIVLPVGISFFTFQSMSYTVDVYRREIKAQKSFLDFAFFVAFFPQLVAGPIVRAKDFLPQLSRRISLRNIDGRRALLLFLSGFFKKACVADNVAAAIDPLFADPSSYAPMERVLGAVLYSVQIYCDFSGYTDMAIAVAAVLGYDLAKNFDAPYFSRNVQEFWQHWHMSLSSWLRDYLYIPLGGNRGSPARVAINLMLTMLLGGLWHGANWTFILWGFLHGLALIVHRTFSRRLKRKTDAPVAATSPVLGVASWLCTFAWVVMCFTIFRTPNIASSYDFFFGMAPQGATKALWAGWWYVVPALGLVHYVIWRRREDLVLRARTVSTPVFYGALGAAASVSLYFTPLNMAPFIYFQF